MDAPVLVQPRSKRYQEAIKTLVLANIAKPKLRASRQKYVTGEYTIVRLSQQTDVPPVLLWAALTNLSEKTQLKYAMLRREVAIFKLFTQGKSLAEIADTLFMLKKDVADYTVNRFAERVFIARPWYDNCHHAVGGENSNEEAAVFLESSLPPTSRLGQKQGELSEPDPETMGRCPTCGHWVVLPCLACRTKEYLKTHKVAPAQPVRPDEDDEETLPGLMFR